MIFIWMISYIIEEIVFIYYIKLLHYYLDKYQNVENATTSPALP